MFGPLALLSAVLWATPALAYVLPADFLARVLSERSQKRKGSGYEMTLQTQEELNGNKYNGRLYLKHPERMRVEDQYKVWIFREGSQASGTADALSAQDGCARWLLPTMLAPLGKELENMTDRIVGSWKQCGIDVDQTSLQRYEGGVAYVVGARPGDLSKPQLWLDKHTFQPLRVITSSGGKRRDVRYSGYGETNVGSWLPRVIEEYRGERLIRRSEVIDGKKARLADGLFLVSR